MPSGFAGHLLVDCLHTEISFGSYPCMGVSAVNDWPTDCQYFV